MPSRLIEPESGSCKVATVRMRVLLPAPFGPSSPNMPLPIVSETLRRALTPLGYVFDRSEIVNANAVSSPAPGDGLGGHFITTSVSQSKSLGMNTGDRRPCSLTFANSRIPSLPVSNLPESPRCGPHPFLLGWGLEVGHRPETGIEEIIPDKSARHTKP